MQQRNRNGFLSGGLGRRLWGRSFLMIALLALSAFMLAACGNDDDDNGNGAETPAGDQTPADNGNGAASPTTAASGDGNGAADETERTLQLAYEPGWTEGVAVTYLWANLLEEEGYDINMQALGIAPLFAGIAGGDIDLYLDGWFPGTHATYQEEFGDDLVLHSQWYDAADLFLTVPSYVEADSLADLADMADVFDSRIVGIEAGAGMMGIAANSVMPTYGLDDWQLVESSTPAMLAELDSAINAQEPIVVTLWSPGYWYDRWDLKNLEDPEGAWGDPDQIWSVVNTEFADNYPQLAGWLENFSMDDEQLSPLLNLISEAGDGQEAAAVEEWLSDDANRELAESWLQ